MMHSRIHRFFLIASMMAFVTGMTSRCLALNLRDAVNLVTKNNPSLLESREKAIQASWQTEVVRAGLFPNISMVDTVFSKKGAVDLAPVNLISGNPTVPFGGNPYNQYQFEFQLTQTLYQYGSYSSVDSSRQDHELRELDAEIAQRDLVRQVIQDYEKVIVDHDLWSDLIREQQIVEKSLITAERRERLGRGQLIDVLQTKTQVALLDATVTEAQNTLQSDTAVLVNLLGKSPSSKIEFRDKLTIPSMDVVNKNVNLGDVRLPDLIENQIEISQISNKLRAELGNFYPTLKLTANYGFGNNKLADVFNGYSNFWNIGVSVSIPIFSGLASIYQRRSYASKRTQLELTQHDLKNKISLDEASAREKLKSAMETIVSDKKALRFAREASAEAGREYRYATTDFLQFLSAQKSEVLATTALYNDEYGYIVALTNYYVAAGQNLNRLVALLQ